MNRCPYSQKELKTPEDIVYLSCGHEYHKSLKSIIENSRNHKCGVYKCHGSKIISYNEAMKLQADVELIPKIQKFIETVVIPDGDDEIDDFYNYNQPIIEKMEPISEEISKIVLEKMKKREEKTNGIIIIPETEDDEDGNRIVRRKWKLGHLRVKRCRNCEYPMNDLYHPYAWVDDHKNGGEKLRRQCDLKAIDEGNRIETLGFGFLIHELASGERVSIKTFE